jgi:hypothetical protein
LLAEPGARFDLLLRQALHPSKRAKFRPTSLRISMRNGWRVYTL